MRGARPCKRPVRRPKPLGVALLLLVVLAPVAAQVATDPALEQEDHGGWTLDLERTPDPFNKSNAVTVLALSGNGHMLLVGLDNGGVLFRNATTGASVDSATASAQHGAVRAASLTHDGRRAALVYDDGFIAVLDVAQTAPLLTLNEGDGAPAQAQPRVSATLSRNGDHVVTTGTAVALHRADEDDGELRYLTVASSDEALGPFVYIASDYPGFGVLAPDGRVSIYAYGSLGMQTVGSQDISDNADGDVVALAVSGNGERFAVAFSSGRVARYTPIISPDGQGCEDGANACLRPDYEGRVDGSPRGLHLDETGLRLATWSASEIVWVEGCTRNIETCGGADAAASTIRVRPPIGSAGTTIDAVDASADVGRLLVRYIGPGAETRLYNMPDLDAFQVSGPAQMQGLVRLDATGTRLFQATGQTVASMRVTAAELPPPGSEGQNGGTAPFGIPRGVLVAAGIGLGALLVLAVLVALLVAARRRPPPRALPALDPIAEEAASSPPALLPLGAGRTAAAGRIRAVTPSAPAAAPPPVGLLVLDDVEVPDVRAPLSGLRLVMRRPGVVRVHGGAAELQTLRLALGGIRAAGGVIAAGGASLRETPLLFARRLQDGLGPPPEPGTTPRSLFVQAGAAHGLPEGVVQRRIERDLAWLESRRTMPLRALAPFDQWKVRLALSLLHRPHVLVLARADLPPPATVAPDAVGAVLRGVGRHYDVLVVLLDDDASPKSAWRMFADQEVRLTNSGFADRRLLKEGRPVGVPPDEPEAQPAKDPHRRAPRTRSSRGPHP